MVNAGAIIVSSLIKDEVNMADRFDYVSDDMMVLLTLTRSDY